MPTKRRVPKDRNPKITPEAVALFRLGLEIIEAGDDELWEEEGGRRREYLDADKRLCWVLLGLAPSEASPLDVQPGQKYYGAECWLESVPKALELRALLQKGKTS